MRKIKNINLNQSELTDLRVNFCGSEICCPLHSYGPAVRDYYIIHYIHNGRGILKIKEKTYSINKGEGFLITPGVLHSYKADEKDPWTYSWIAFNGKKASEYIAAAGLSTDNPISRCDNHSLFQNIFLQMLAADEMRQGGELKVLGLLHILLSELINTCKISTSIQKEQKLKVLLYERALEFIEMNYSRTMQISDISKYLCIGRTYLFMIFKEYLGISPQEFLINHRIDKAVDLMRSERLTIGDIARSVGYEDPLQFSKIFKKVKGLPPKEYRQSM